MFRIVVRDIGGGFGTKTPLYPEDAALGYASGKLKRNIRWRSSRSDEFHTTLHARNQETVAEMAFDQNGKILALRAGSPEFPGATQLHLNGPVGSV